MGAHYEPICEHAGVIRLFLGWRSFGHPYEFAIFVVREGDCAHFKGLRAERFSRQNWRAVNDCLAENSFASAYWERYKGGITIPVRRQVIHRKVKPMSIQHAHDHATKLLDKAIAAAAPDPALYAALVELKAQHEAALPTALGNAGLADRLMALAPLAKAVDGVEKAGLASPDQSHPMHQEAKDAIHACALVGFEVVKGMLARIGK
jgi:hypothetical protein